MEKNKEVSIDRLYAIGHQSTYWQTNEYLPDVVGINILKASKLPITGYLQYLRNMVVIGHNKNNLYTELRFKLGLRQNEKVPTTFLYYSVPRSKAKVGAAIKFFTDRKMTVIDLTGEQKPAPKVISKPKQKGLVKLSYSLDKSDYINFSRLRSNDAERITDPEWITKIGANKESSPSSLCQLNYDTTKSVISLFGSTCGVARTMRQMDRYTKKGVKQFDYVLDLVADEISNNQAVLAYYSNNLEDTPHDFKLVVGSPTLSKVFGLYVNLNNREKHLVKIYDYCSTRKYTFDGVSSKFDNLKLQIESLPKSPVALQLKDEIVKSNILQILNFGRIVNWVDDGLRTQGEIDSVVAILKEALKH
jgi:hypothetical protein